MYYQRYTCSVARHEENEDDKSCVGVEIMKTRFKLKMTKQDEKEEGSGCCFVDGKDLLRFPVNKRSRTRESNVNLTERVDVDVQSC